MALSRAFPSATVLRWRLNPCPDKRSPGHADCRVCDSYNGPPPRLGGRDPRNQRQP